MNDHPDPDDNGARATPDTDPLAGVNTAATALLALNGYNTIRAQVLDAVNTLAAIPPDAWQAAKDYNHAAVDRLTVNPDVNAGRARDAALVELELLELGRRLAHAVHAIGERQDARRRITGQ